MRAPGPGGVRRPGLNTIGSRLTGPSVRHCIHCAAHGAIQRADSFGTTPVCTTAVGTSGSSRKSRPLARTGTTTPAIFGTGHQAAYEVGAVSRVRPNGEVLGVGRSAERTEHMTTALAARGHTARGAGAEEACARADVVVTATTARAGTLPLFEAAWVRLDGTLVPGLVMTAASREHGTLTARDGARLPVGTRLRILPNHACATAAQLHGCHLVDSTPTTNTAPAIQAFRKRVTGW
ncbi:hypothetical protein [Streptomyces sp. TRM68367]|uniref:hypothetical protein n=1 Tax=Streptomyces sp. TRM68367 TaxID=2758415 RepID=UPI0021CF5A19|nr:hypothetical protein [Streptomyces sp. TRM68367]